MDPFSLLATAIVTAAVFGYLNHRFLKLPTTIGVMLIALAMSLGLFVLEAFGFGVRAEVTRLLESFEFGPTLLHRMLAFLLFAGALHVKVDDLLGQKWVIGLLATAGVLASTFMVGGLARLLLSLFGVDVGWLPCFLFGALISPTDPIAVLGILRQAGAPKSLETKIVGESLFNDGVGVVVFTLLLAFAGGPGEGGAHVDPSLSSALALIAREVLGSIALGFGCGWVAYRMLRSVDNYQVEVLITLALCMGLYALAAGLHSSGPIAVVVAGLLIGNSGRTYAMSDHVREHLDTFWELIDEILNVLLFVLIGMEVLVLELEWTYVAVGLLLIPLVLLARFASIGGVVALLRKRRKFTPHAVKVMTWGGLRGGISIALALYLPADLPARDLLLTATYVVVVFSIAIQGLTIGRLIRIIPGAGGGPGAAH